MELLLTGRWFDAEEAARWGLVNRILPAGELMAAGAKDGR
jgi:crotonobetainyl-CoA hydratase